LLQHVLAADDPDLPVVYLHAVGYRTQIGFAEGHLAAGQFLPNRVA
jgi:hypothetical protein